jgi:7-cyano-7-deazaguanine synthase in queuosine biosynthesis
MISPRLFVCSGAKIGVGSAVAKGRLQIDLDSIGPKANVNIRFENVTKALHQHPPSRLVDFLEIASYVFTADCATDRGEDWTDGDSKEAWGRDFAFVIPVRDPAFWNKREITSLVKEALSFLSNDKYSFTFVPLKRDRVEQHYFEFAKGKEWRFHAPERVVMFSGGLDSLAGAVETASTGAQVVLVSHRSVSTLSARQKDLYEELEKQFPNQLIHVPVWINKDEKFGREPTQRTRSFLFAALGAVVAEPLGAGGVRFYENGVVSLNLPVAEEVLRARASRTTHPVTLHHLESLCSAVTDRGFAVDNPYLFKTKTEVVQVLASHKVPHLIGHTCSCAHLMFKSKTQKHCGTCSQCIDRRFAIMASGLQKYDSEADYVSDVFTGPRKDGYEKKMAVDYTRHGIDLHNRLESELANSFNAELGRAIRYENKRGEAAEQLISMHKRHGKAVTDVLKEQIAERSADLAVGTLEPSSLLALVVGKNLGSSPPATDATPGAAAPVTLASDKPLTDKAISAAGDRILDYLLSRVASRVPARPAKRRKLVKRDIVIFAAIKLGHKGPRYCSFLHEHGIKPQWPEGAPTSYPQAYKIGSPWAKKIQDEKTRSSAKMKVYSDAVFAEALNRHLPGEFDKITKLINSRNSQGASKISSV